MHELSLARSVVETCSAHAGGARVSRVTLEIGTLTCVFPEALQLCFEAAVRATPLEGAELAIVRIPGRSRCRECGQAVEVEEILAVCPCGSTDLEPPAGGDELRIRSMQLTETA